MRQLTYADAIREAHAELMREDERVFVIGQGVWSPWYAGTSLKDLDREFGRERVIDTPVSENAVTGAAVGAALAGMRPIVFHPRMDFMLLAVDPIVNQAANWSYLFGGQVSSPVVIRASINRRGEQGAQHSQALQAMFAHVPGLKVVMPASPADAKGLLVSAVNDPNPVLYIDDRELYSQLGPVPEGLYGTPIGRAVIRRPGRDVTIVAISAMVPKALKAAPMLAAMGIDVEVIDLRSLKPWDDRCVLESVERTGRLLIAEAAWRTGGFAAEIAAVVSEKLFESLVAPIRRLCLPDSPAPTSAVQEDAYYLSHRDVVSVVVRLMQYRPNQKLVAAA